MSEPAMPVCPECNQRDKVQLIRPAAGNTFRRGVDGLTVPAWEAPSDLSEYWCSRCNAILSALPVRHAEPADPVERQRSQDRVNAILNRPKRKRKEQA